MLRCRTLGNLILTVFAGVLTGPGLAQVDRIPTRG
jgi:hypothetical protein